VVRIKISGFLEPEDIIPELTSMAKDEVLAELAAKVVARHPAINRENFSKYCLNAKGLGARGSGMGLQFPMVRS
jgi:hypothetical protein